MKNIYLFIFLLLTTALCFAQDTKEEANEHYTLGNIYYKHGLYDQAQEEFQKALQIVKSSPDADQTPINKTNEINLSTKNEDAIATSPYIIDKGDTLKVTVWENPDLSQELTVRPDGMISMPLIGEIQAKGNAIPELDKELTSRLKTYIRNPDVSVSLKEIGGNKVIVMGEVNKPGKYSLNDASTVIDAIASAGGFNRDAIQNSIIVISGGLQNPVPRRVHVQNAIRKGTMGDNNITLKPNDIVFVPRKFVADLNYFMMKILEPLTSGTGSESTIKNY